MTEHQKKYGELDPGETVEAWHVFTARGRTWQGNLPVQVGETMTVDGEIIPCSNGLHGSILAIDALRYAPGPMIKRVP